jgi:two-component system response regulator RegX3
VQVSAPHRVSEPNTIPNGKTTLAPTVLEAGPVRIDLERHTVTVAGRELALPLKEYDLLEYLVQNADRVLTRRQLVNRVWGPEYLGDTRTLDAHIKRLRSKIEQDPSSPQHLLTVRGVGYRYDT